MTYSKLIKIGLGTWASVVALSAASVLLTDSTQPLRDAKLRAVMGLFGFPVAAYAAALACDQAVKMNRRVLDSRIAHNVKKLGVSPNSKDKALLAVVHQIEAVPEEKVRITPYPIENHVSQYKPYNVFYSTPRKEAAIFSFYGEKQGRAELEEAKAYILEQLNDTHPSLPGSRAVRDAAANRVIDTEPALLEKMNSQAEYSMSNEGRHSDNDYGIVTDIGYPRYHYGNYAKPSWMEQERINTEIADYKRDKLYNVTVKRILPQLKAA